jgi:phosphotriesterase-related protein
MIKSAQKGKAQTVLGTIDPNKLGPIMTHEHLLIDFEVMFTQPPEGTSQKMAHAPVSIENLGWISQYYYSNFDNLKVLDEDTAINEAILYRRSGGKTIVDATTIGIGRNPLALERISRESGINVVMGAGYYVHASQKDSLQKISEDEISNQIIQEIQVGVENTDIKAGIIGEIGCTWPLEKTERKVLRAASLAQIETGASILIHPGRHEDAPIEILQILSDSGADMSRVIMGHLDRTVEKLETLKNIASSGCVLEWDLFGQEISFYQPSNLDMPNDVQRMNIIRTMIDDGMGKNIVISHDICTKHRLVKYGGHGYGYILEHIIPRMRSRGFTNDEILNITHKNAARLLTIN